MQNHDKSFSKLVEIIETLRSHNGCPWDRDQTHSSLKRNLIEESYEVIEAIEEGDPGKLSEELGDLLAQIMIHSQIAREENQFDIATVIRDIAAKLVRRHPHVFGSIQATTSRDVQINWDNQKQKERPNRSRVEGIPKELPSLAYSQLIQDRVSHAGFDWENLTGVLNKISEEVDEHQKANSPEESLAEFGDILFTLVNLGRWMGIHAEDSLRQANKRFIERYMMMEEIARSKAIDLMNISLEERESLWQEAKKALIK